VVTSSESSHGAQPVSESYNPWSVVNLVFHHLAEEGLHPILGESGDPGAPAAALLVALGIEPAAEGNRRVKADVHSELGALRAAFFDDPDSGAEDSGADSR
jgi:hypothetical protein